MGLWQYAKTYAAAGDVVNREGLVVPTYFLHGHSIELSLKAFLRGAGFTLQQLQQIGHDLNKALESAEAHGLRRFVEFSDADAVVINLLTQGYKDKELEYMVTGVKNLPRLDLLSSLSNRLVGSLESYCYDRIDVFPEAI